MLGSQLPKPATMTAGEFRQKIAAQKEAAAKREAQTPGVRENAAVSNAPAKLGRSPAMRFADSQAYRHREHPMADLPPSSHASPLPPSSLPSPSTPVKPEPGPSAPPVNSRNDKVLSSPEKWLLGEMTADRNLFQLHFDGKAAAPRKNLIHYMESMVEDYNRRNPGMNVRYFENFETMSDHVLNNKAELERGPMHCVVRNSHGAHQTAWRFQSHDGKVTAIGLDSVEKGEDEAELTASNFSRCLEKRPGMADASVLFATGAQRDGYSCGVFALQFLNVFRKDAQQFDHLSRAVLLEKEKGGPKFRYCGNEAAIRSLPPRVWKNAHSRKAILGLLASRPEAARAPVSKRHESIEERLRRLTKLENPLQDAPQAKMTRGADKKRLHAMNVVIDELEARPKSILSGLARRWGFGKT
jgi:hypothetical protein